MIAKEIDEQLQGFWLHSYEDEEGIFNYYLKFCERHVIVHRYFEYKHTETPYESYHVGQYSLNCNKFLTIKASDNSPETLIEEELPFKMRMSHTDYLTLDIILDFKNDEDWRIEGLRGFQKIDSVENINDFKYRN